jgi:hypothetical protein
MAWHGSRAPWLRSGQIPDLCDRSVAYGSVNATILNAGIFNIDNETHARVGYTVGGGIEAIVYAIGR